MRCVLPSFLNIRRADTKAARERPKAMGLEEAGDLVLHIKKAISVIKRKISGNKSPVSQRLLLEACAMNCERIFSEVASESVLDEMVWLVKNGEGDSESRSRAFQLIRAWGRTKDLAYLPVFQQTYMSLEGDNGLNAPRNEENTIEGQSSLESLMQRPVQEEQVRG